MLEVHISDPEYPEYGKTVSQCNGGFDLVVNGGAALTVSIEGTSYLPVRRRAMPRWQTYTILPEVVLTVADAPIEVDLAAGGAVQASPVTDKDGVRRATLLFPPGTVATKDGQPLGSTVNVRATEYTVGADGPTGAGRRLSCSAATATPHVGERLVAGARALPSSEQVVMHGQGTSYMDAATVTI